MSEQGEREKSPVPMTEAEAAFWAKRCRFPYLPEPIGEFELESAEVPEWLRKVGQWEGHLLDLEALKTQGGAIVIGGSTRLEKGSVLYLFGLRGLKHIGKIRSSGLILLPLTLESEFAAERIMLGLIEEFETLAHARGSSVKRHYE